ncbi:HDOD domain-containing protein, partial [Fibrobacterota bacterium]
ENLPVFPETARKLMSEIENPDSSAADIARIVKYDPSVSAAILKMANSTYYNPMGNQIGNIKQAIARLGFVEVRKICIAFGTMKLFIKTSGLIDLSEFWKHCIGVAMSTKILIQLKGQDKTKHTDAFTAGLFHDVGILILDQFFESEYRTVCDISKNEAGQIIEIEKKALGIDHGEIGRKLLEKWNFPAFICETVRFHHEPDKCDPAYKHLCQIIHIADFAVSSTGNFEPGESMPEGFNQGAWYDLGLEVETIPDLLEDVKKEIQGAAVFTSLGLN